MIHTRVTLDESQAAKREGWGAFTEEGKKSGGVVLEQLIMAKAGHVWYVLRVEYEPV